MSQKFLSPWAKRKIDREKSQYLFKGGQSIRLSNLPEIMVENELDEPEQELLEEE